MEPHEMQEHTEHAQHAGEKGIGLTMAIVAVLLAIATLLSHRSHTEEVLLQGEINDKWGFYQAKHIRAYEFGMHAEMMAVLPGGHDAALSSLKKSTEEECGVPAEEGCTSPFLKGGSPVLKQILDEQKAAKSAEAHEGKAEHEAKTGESSPAGTHVAKEEHATKAEGGEGKKERTPSEGSVKIRKEADEMEREKQVIQKRANFYDGSELFLEISIVLCSIALLAGNKMFWRISFLSTIGGIGVALWGLLGLFAY